MNLVNVLCLGPPVLIRYCFSITKTIGRRFLFVNGYFVMERQALAMRLGKEDRIKVDPEIEKATIHRNACNKGKIVINIIIFVRIPGKIIPRRKILEMEGRSI